METFERRSVSGQPACTSSGCSSHLSFTVGAQEERKPEITERPLRAKNQVSNFTALRVPRCPLKREKQRPTEPLAAEKEWSRACQLRQPVLFPDTATFSLQGRSCCTSQSYPKAKIPPVEQDKHSHGKGTLCSPEEMQSRCSCRSCVCL